MRALTRSRRVALPLAALALAGTGVAAYGAVGDDSPAYRTVRAEIGSVEQELTVSGTIAPSASSALTFGTSGTVAQVKVAQGEKVEKGEVLAVLDRAALRSAVDQANAEVASAKARLAEDRETQATAVSTAATPPTTGTTARTKATPTKKQAPDPQLSAQQDAVLKAQSATTAALAAAEQALADQQAACADPATTVAPTPTDEPSASPTSTTTSAVLSQECTDALVAVQSAQSSAGRAQAALQKALTALSATLTQALDAAQSSPPSTPTPATSVPDAAGSTPSSGDGQSVTAATLAQDQAAIDRAAASLVSAQAELAGAVVRAPADGTVVSLALARGGAVSAGATVATVVAPGLTTVSAQVSATQAARLKVGLDVEVTPAGATEALPGAVSRVEHVATSSASEGADPTYTVEVVLDQRGLPLADGMPATVAAVVGSAQDVVVVPASAVGNGSVTVVEDGTARRVQVTTGIVGATRIEVTDGLAEGAEVVLADLDADLPSEDSTQQGPGGVGGGGFTVGGTPPVGLRMPG